MPKRMLIDAAHPEETRVVVTSGTRLEDFDFESSIKKQVKGNIYLAKVTRVEPSLQAAFIDYGGNRHGFLAFSEIHPDYYRIPVSDRRFEADSPIADDTEGDGAGEDATPLATALPEPVAVGDASEDAAEGASSDEPADGLPAAEPAAEADDPRLEPRAIERPAAEAPVAGASIAQGSERSAPPASSLAPEEAADSAGAAGWNGAEHDAALALPEGPEEDAAAPTAMALRAAEEALFGLDVAELPDAAPEVLETVDDGADAVSAQSVETFGGDEVEEVEEADAERRRYQPARHYKIQEVVKRRQIMLVQVAKEERGNKGAALTTYLSLAGRYCVLMPNTNRGGGVSRKITSITDRRRLKEILEDLEIPEGMGVIVRTAGAERSKAEIKRDYEYLLRLWNEIRDLTLKSTAPALIYEEGNLIKRSIRDLYARDIDEVLVEGEEAYKTAKAFMRTLMPSHAKRVQPYRDPQIGLFHRFQIETQIDAIHSPVAQLRSGGYVVINQTEALVSIDVNSGRSTRERNIEETALRTNLEAAEEIARQLRLRDLAGLIVIDFIDMEEHRNQIAVERRLKDALKSDRARIQVGRISPFGLLEMSRQRLRPSLAETSTQPCPHCGGTGFIRSVESAALHVLRSIEEEGIRRRAAEIAIYVPINVALYILNQKRESLNQIETRYGIKVSVQRDDSLVPPAFRLERLRPFAAGEALPPVRAVQAPSGDAEADDDMAEAEEIETEDGDAEAVPNAAAVMAEAGGEDERGRRHRPRRRRRVREGRDPAVPGEAARVEVGPSPSARDEEAGRDGDAERRRRRRGRRGGSRARQPREERAPAVADEGPSTEHEAPMAAESQPAWAAEPDPAPEYDSAPAAEPDPSRDYELPPMADPVGEHEMEPALTAEHEPERDYEAPAVADYEPATAFAAPPQSAPEATAEAEDGIPFVSAAEHIYEATAAEAVMASHDHGETAAPPRPNEEVLTVTEKPANPRRGWWQRLMQS